MTYPCFVSLPDWTTGTCGYGREHDSFGSASARGMHELAGQMLRRNQHVIARQGATTQSGTVVDATLIAHRARPKTPGGERDPEMHRPGKETNGTSA